MTLWYLNVKNTAGGSNNITAHAKAKILVLIGQFKAATHGDESRHDSQPSAHGKHSYAVGLL